MAKQSTPKAENQSKVETVVVVSIEKLTQGEYRLVRLTLEGDIVAKREVLATDIPGIIQGKLMIELNQQKFLR